MNISYFYQGKTLILAALLSMTNLGYFANIVQAQPINKAIKTQEKISALKNRDSQSLNLHLILSRITADTIDLEVLEEPDILELSEIEQMIPLNNQPLIARSFSGEASWYGPGFHGRLTANGERYNQNAMTAAHRSLRFGTRVKVTNLNNGRSVILRINDRGPYVKGRVIDVSAAAARSLGMIKTGVAPVRVTILGR